MTLQCRGWPLKLNPARHGIAHLNLKSTVYNLKLLGSRTAHNPSIAHAYPYPGFGLFSFPVTSRAVVKEQWP